MGTKGKIALGAVVGIVVIGAVSANAGGDSDSGSGDKSKDSSASAKRESGKPDDAKSDEAEQAAEKKIAFKGDGDYEVGTDIKPGTYRTTGNTDDMCYWERAKDSSGEVDSSSPTTTSAAPVT